MTTESTAKTEQILSDDCAVSEGADGVGGEIFPHRGQSIEVRTGVRSSLADVRFLHNLRRLQAEADAINTTIEDKPGETAEARKNRVDALKEAKYTELLLPHIDAAVQIVMKTIVAWDWTNQFGEPLGTPTDAKSYEDLSIAEIMYLVQVSRGRTPAAEGKGSSS